MLLIFIILPPAGAAVLHLLVMKQQVVNDNAPTLDLRSRTIFGKYFTDEDLQLTWSSITSPDQPYSCLLNKSDNIYSFALPLEGDESVFTLSTVPIFDDPPMVVFTSTIVTDPDCFLLNMGTIQVHWRLARTIAAAQMDISTVPRSVGVRTTMAVNGISIFQPRVSAYESTVNAWDSGWDQLKIGAERKWEGLRATAMEAVSIIHLRAELIASGGSISSASDLYIVLASLGTTLLTSATLSVVWLLLQWACSTVLRWLLGWGDEGDRATTGSGDSNSTSSPEELLFCSPQSGSSRLCGFPYYSMCAFNASPYSDTTGSLSSSSSDESSIGDYGSCISFPSTISTDGARAVEPCTGTDRFVANGSPIITKGDKGADSDSDSDELFTLLLQIDSFSTLRLTSAQQAHQQRIEALFREK